MSTLTLKKLLLLFFLLVPSLTAAAGLGELRLSLIEGDVQIKPAETKDWTPAVINFPLKDGDQIWVPNEGRAEVKSRRGTIIRLDEESALDVLTVENDALQFYLSMGLAYVNATGEPNTTLQIDTPLSSIQIHERAKFSTEVSNERLTLISVYLGAIIVEGRKGETIVQAGKLLSIDKYSADLSTLGMIDSWERWNGDKDRAIEEQKKSLHYLPEELAGYANDFDSNGEWVDMPSYGHVWRPTVQVTAGWAPYRHGRWVWIENDYVWIAQEPWGWAPYHYGRWSFISRHGWCWVPPARHEAYWGPGYVGWVRTPTYVSWVPLAPREIYYGHGNYGPHSININHVDARQVVVKNVYKNVYVENSVTTVHNDTFIRGKHVDFKVKENPFLKEKINVGRPQIQPELQTRSADLREIPPFNQPPETVKNIDVEKLQKRHSLKKSQNTHMALPEKEQPPITTEDNRQRRQPETNNRHSSHDEMRPPSNRKEVQAPPSREAVATPAVEHEVPVPQVSPPPPAMRQEERPRPPSELIDRQSPRNEIKRRPDRQEIQTPPSREQTSPPEVKQEGPTPEVSAPPPAMRQEERPRPPSEVIDRQSPRNEIKRRPDRQEIQAPPRQGVPPSAIEQAVQAPQFSAPPPATRQNAPPPENLDTRTSKNNRHKKSSAKEESELPSEPELPLPEHPSK